MRTRTSGTKVVTMLVAGVALLLLAGCGGSSDDGAATVAGTGSGSARDASSDRGQKFAQCMRKQGLPDFPDPVNGRMELKAEQGSGLDPSSSQFQAAEQACRSLAPVGPADGSPESIEQQEQMHKHAACMRKNGVPAFPDPVDGRLMLQKGGGVDPESPEFESASQKCRSLQPGGVR